MFRQLLTVFVLLAVSSAGAVAQTTYVPQGEVKGFFCRFFGMLCSFKKVVAVSMGAEETRPLPRIYTTVSDYVPGKDGKTGRCRITTKSDESRYGWWAVLWDWWTEAPVFYALKEDGSYEKLGSPEFIVFDCLQSGP